VAKMKSNCHTFSFDSMVSDMKFMRNNKTQSLFSNCQTKVTRKERRPDDGESCTHLSIAQSPAHQGSAIGRSSRRIFLQEQLCTIETCGGYATRIPQDRSRTAESACDSRGNSDN
jgi:hypothetical protein